MFPLHLAALNAHSDCCRKLLSSGELVESRFSFLIKFAVNKEFCSFCIVREIRVLTSTVASLFGTPG